MWPHRTTTDLIVTATSAWGVKGVRRPVWCSALVVCLFSAAPGCGGDSPSVLEPESDAARKVERLWWVLFGISFVVVAVVAGFLIAAIRRRRSQLDRDVDRRTVPWGDKFVVVAGVIVPGVILAGTFVLALGVLDDLAAPSDDPALTLEVVAHDWWWEVRYPNGAVTANEIHIPLDQPVEVLLPTADVVHSFWVPELQVKEDHIPRHDNRLWLHAERVGRFRGQCAEFCGLQHAHMAFLVEVMAPDDFDAWLADQARPAEEPTTAASREGRELLTGSSCAGCHAVRGTTAEGELGPDLTHLASRETIGAGLVPLDRESLADFIADPQDDKPGATMPPTELTADEIDAVVAYLMELE